MVAECEGFFWVDSPDGPVLLEHGSPGRPDPGVNIPAPTAEELIEFATSSVRAQGSGIAVQPASGGVVGIPLLVHAAAPRQTLSTQLFGRAVEVELEATRFTYDFGDGTAPLVTRDPGAPYPSRTLSHVYATAEKGVTIRLETMWSGSVTSPFTGEWARIEGVVRTVEYSQPFDVREAVVALVDANE